MADLNVSIPDELHQSLKVMAAQKGTTIKDLVTEILTKLVKKMDGAK